MSYTGYFIRPTRLWRSFIRHAGSIQSLQWQRAKCLIP